MSEVSTAPRISAVVCTYNRAEFLQKCLQALSEQALPEAEYEVIVVNNNSTDNTQEVAEHFAAANANFRVVLETKQGLAAARNRGMREADSTIAAFTDDDAIPNRDWLERLAARFESLGPEIAAVGGEIDPIWEVPRPNWLSDSLMRPLSAHLGWSSTPKVLGNQEWLCEVNSAYRIEPTLKAGGFPEDLGRIGTNLLSGENAVNSLLADAGMKFYYDPEIRVQHFIPAARLTVQWFKRRMFWQGVTGFFVNAYLRENGCHAPYSVQIDLPMNAQAWLTAFDDTNVDELEQSLGTLYNLGFLLAAKNLIVGR